MTYFNSLGPSDAIWQQKTGSNIGSGNGLVPDGTKPLPEPMLTYHQWHSSMGYFTAGISAINHCNWLEKYSSKISLKSPRPHWVNKLVPGRFGCHIKNTIFNYILVFSLTDNFSTFKPSYDNYYSVLTYASVISGIEMSPGASLLQCRKRER